MHECGIRFFVQQPGEMEQRRLHLAVIESVTESGGTARSSADMVFEPGEALIVFFERDRAFMQQAIRIDAVMPDESAPPVVVSKPLIVMLWVAVAANIYFGLAPELPITLATEAAVTLLEHLQ